MAEVEIGQEVNCPFCGGQHVVTANEDGIPVVDCPAVTGDADRICM